MQETKTAPQGAESGSFGFSGMAYNQVIVFRNKADFELALRANPCMKPIIGTSADDAINFPGVYIAGIKANSRMDKSVDRLSATRK